MTERVMIDTETLGLEPRAAVLSIGACRFQPGDGDVGETFYVESNQNSCLTHGLTVDNDTLQWWREQDMSAPLDGDVSLPDTLHRLSRYIGDADEVWANSPSFDCEVLEAAYNTIGAVERGNFTRSGMCGLSVHSRMQWQWK